MNDLIVTSDTSVAVKNAAELWAKSKTTADSERFVDIVRDKKNAVGVSEILCKPLISS